VRLLFYFYHVLEVIKPAKNDGDRLVASCDLRTDRRAGKLNIISTHYEKNGSATNKAPKAALERYGQALRLKPTKV
jgi:uncharacterized protein YcaQ